MPISSLKVQDFSLRSTTATLTSSVITSDLPLAVWSQQNVAAARRNTIAIRTLWGEDATAIEDVEIEGHDGHSSAIEDCEGVWYTLSGMPLQSRPTVSGVYIHDGKKVVVSPRVR